MNINGFLLGVGVGKVSAENISLLKILKRKQLDLIPKLTGKNILKKKILSISAVLKICHYIPPKFKLT